MFISSCGQRDKSKPNKVYMPDMYYSLAYEPYSYNENFADKSSARKPVAGTVKRGFVPYDMPNTTEGYQLSKTKVVSPLEKNEDNLRNGKANFNIYCALCHGEKGDGQGILVQNEKILGVPDFSKVRLPDITEGSIFHVITYGKGIMGSHASQLTKKERWEIVQYVEKLRNDL
ncbi:cytochrome C [Ichthyobacterium seriolicida]|uniref:Cytochrome C n=2 Tax=Ichthyobacterium seriolicida TaxID=242600 RepID=A0A1J1E2J8_9FLAO|nr:cytochrome C [Ichthyobacterium seriolicida]